MDKFDQDYIDNLKSDPDYLEVLSEKLNLKENKKYEEFFKERQLGLVCKETPLGVIIDHFVFRKKCSLTIIVNNEKDVKPLSLSFLKERPGGLLFDFSIDSFTQIDGNESRKVYEVKYHAVKHPSSARDTLENALEDVIKDQDDDFMDQVRQCMDRMMRRKEEMDKRGERSPVLDILDTLDNPDNTRHYYEGEC